MMFSVSTFGSKNKENFVVLIDKNVDTDDWISVFELRCVRELEREIESCDVQFIEVFSIVIQFICVLISSINITETAP